MPEDDSAPADVTWQDALPTRCYVTTVGGGEDLPLRDAIDTLVAHGAGALTVWDGDMDLLLTLDPAGQQDHWLPGSPGAKRQSPFGNVSLSIDGTHLREEGAWPLCAALAPAFAVGYNPADLENALADGGPSGAGPAQAFDRILLALAAGRLPVVSPWMLFTYAADRLIGAGAVFDELLGDTAGGRWAHRLPGRGLSVVALPPAWRYPSEVAAEVAAAAERLERRGFDEREGWRALWNRALGWYERALGIYHAAGDRAGEAAMRRKIAHLREFAPRRAREESGGGA
jgi:hypothetical protein